MDIILFEVGKRLISFIQIFAIYIILNGHLSPGGGFAGGTLLGVSLILYRLVHGSDWYKNVLSYRKIIASMGIALALYGLLKGYSFLVGGTGIHLWEVPLGTPGRIFSGGLILPLNIIVGAVVGLTIYVFYCLFDKGDI